MSRLRSVLETMKMLWPCCTDYSRSFPWKAIDLELGGDGIFDAFVASVAWMERTLPPPSAHCAVISTARPGGHLTAWKELIG